MATLLDAVTTVLADAGTPLTVGEITSRVLALGSWKTSGKTPAATVEAQLASNIKKIGSSSPFVRTAPRTYGLRPASAVTQQTPGVHVKPKPGTASMPTKVVRVMTYLEAAEAILGQSVDRKPIHYRDLTTNAIKQGLLSSNGLTPAQTMYAQLLTDVDRRVKRGDPPRFARYPKGLVGLAAWSQSGLVEQITAHNAAVKRELRDHLRTMDPHLFEVLMGELLVALGFQSVGVTSSSGDEGVDVVGTLVVGDVMRTQMAVQVKRWKANVQSPTVQQLRGSLGAHDQGLIITTSDFSPGARAEAAKPDRTPVALMNGEELVSLLVEHQIRVSRSNLDLLALDLDQLPGVAG